MVDRKSLSGRRAATCRITRRVHRGRLAVGMKPQALLDIPSAPAVRACLAAAPLAAWLLPPRFRFLSIYL